MIPVTRLTDRQRDLLRLVRVEDNAAVFTGAQIPDWPALKTVLVTLGGAWKKASKAAPGRFVFAEDLDAKERVRLALESGEILDLDGAGFFPTPAPLADRLVQLADIQDDEGVLEPSAGVGAIVAAILRGGHAGRIDCYELIAEHHAHIHKLHDVAPPGVAKPQVRGLDFLAAKPVRLYDVACMNPPFAKRADIAHVRHALDFLRPGGRLVSIMSAGVLYRTDKITQSFRGLIESMGGRFEPNHDGSFADSGTMVRTVTLVTQVPA